MNRIQREIVFVLASGIILLTLYQVRSAPTSANETALIAASYYLYPYNLHLAPGSTTTVPLTIIDDSGHVVSGDIEFYGYDTSLISVSEGGHVTALREETSSEIGTLIHATINGNSIASTTVVRVLSVEYSMPFSQLVGNHTILYYPPYLNGEDLSGYVTQYEIPTANEYAYLIQAQLMGVEPFRGAKQIFEVDFGESETQRVCGISGNPIRLGWNVKGNDWQNCFLVPFIVPRSPQWMSLYHELGHNFTWASPTFGKGLGRFEYSEGIATAIGLVTIQTIMTEPTTYPLGSEAQTSLQLQFVEVSDEMLTDFQVWLNDGADFSQLNPDIVDGIWLSYHSQRPADFTRRFFMPLQPRYSSWVSPLLNSITEDEQHTLFAALVSAAVSQDLSNTFSTSYHYPLNSTLFASAYTIFKLVADQSFYSLYLPVVVR